MKVFFTQKQYITPMTFGTSFLNLKSWIKFFFPLNGGYLAFMLFLFSTKARSADHFIVRVPVMQVAVTPYEVKASLKFMPYPGLQPGSFAVAAGSPNHYIAWSGKSSYRKSLILKKLDFKFSMNSPLNYVKRVGLQA